MNLTPIQYHVHQRGSRLAVYLVAQTGGANLPSLIAGVVATNLTWRWVFWIILIFVSIGLLLAIFFGWETAFNREALYDIDTSSVDVCWVAALNLIRFADEDIESQGHGRYKEQYERNRSSRRRNPSSKVVRRENGSIQRHLYRGVVRYNAG